jgi:hypothetical protein
VTAKEDRCANATDGIEAGGERRTGRVEQVRTQRAGKVLSRSAYRRRFTGFGEEGPVDSIRL